MTLIRFLCALLLAALCGCSSGAVHAILNPEWKRTVEVCPKEGSLLNLKNDVVFKLYEARKDAMGGSRTWTILGGSYALHAMDPHGLYLRHETRGFIRSGNFGIAEAGGLYIPFDDTKEIAVWKLPVNNNQAVSLFGPLAAGLPQPDPKTQVFILAWAPIAISKDIRACLDPSFTQFQSTSINPQEPNKSL